MVIRIDGNVDGLALPLRLGVNGLKHNMKEEGLFRSSLLLDYWPKYCNAQFKGKYQKNHQLIDWLIDWLIIIHRIGPSIPIFNKVKGLIDAGADENAILGHYKDPHLYTAMIK